MADKSNQPHAEGTSIPENVKNDSLFFSPAVPRPTVTKVKAMAEELQFDLADDQLEEITGLFDGMLDGYDTLYRMVEPKPPVKYPRTPGYRPSPEENRYNAWYVKTDIMGAPTGKLAGKRIAVKDSIAVAGVPMMNGTKLLEGYIPDYDATVVTRMLDAGGHILGKAVCENFCSSGSSVTTDLGPVLNPCDTSRTTGGSSSGNAALLAAGEVEMAIGGDQGGSVRIPGSWSGIIGHKPTFGLIPYTGAIAIEATVDHLGPMTRTVRDCALLLEVIAGYDGMDHRQPETFPEVPEYSKDLDSDLTGMKIGILKEGFLNCEPDVVEVVKKAAEGLTKKGALVEEVNVPLHSSGQHIWRPLISEGGMETITVKAGSGPSSKGFHDTNMHAYLTRALRQSANDTAISFKVFHIFARYLKETNNYNFYCRGSNMAMSLTKAYDQKLKEYNVLVMPTLPYIAPKIPSKNATISEMMKHVTGMVQNTSPFNATGHPALTINAGTADGLPIGMMIVGKKWHDQQVLNVALAHEELNG